MFEAHQKRKTLRDYFRKLGPALQKRHGWQAHYKPSLVLRMASDLGLSTACICYGYAIYCTREDFDAHHAQTGEHCDYDAMRGELSAGHYGRGSEYDPPPTSDHDAGLGHSHSAYGSSSGSDHSDSSGGDSGGGGGDFGGSGGGDY